MIPLASTAGKAPFFLAAVTAGEAFDGPPLPPIFPRGEDLNVRRCLHKPISPQTLTITGYYER